MKPSLQDLIKEIDNIDIADITSSWQWCLGSMHAVVTISCLGDMFLLGDDNAVYWLQTDLGKLSKIAENFEEYKEFLNDPEKTDDWFLSPLVEKLLDGGKTLKSNQVYSYKISPVLGGEYTVENIEPVSMSVHFSFSGQICEQIKDLPDGTKVNFNFIKGI
jgi:hypothetical protein